MSFEAAEASGAGAAIAASTALAVAPAGVKSTQAEVSVASASAAMSANLRNMDILRCCERQGSRSPFAGGHGAGGREHDPPDVGGLRRAPGGAARGDQAAARNTRDADLVGLVAAEHVDASAPACLFGKR